MERLEIGFVGVIAILALIGIRVPIGVAMGVTAFFGIWAMMGLGAAVGITKAIPFDLADLGNSKSFCGPNVSLHGVCGSRGWPDP